MVGSDLHCNAKWQLGLIIPVRLSCQPRSVLHRKLLAIWNSFATQQFDLQIRCACVLQKARPADYLRWSYSEHGPQRRGTTARSALPRERVVLWDFSTFPTFTPTGVASLLPWLQGDKTSRSEIVRQPNTVQAPLPQIPRSTTHTPSWSV